MFTLSSWAPKFFSTPFITRSRLLIGQGPLYKPAPAADPALSISMRKGLHHQEEREIPERAEEEPAIVRDFARPNSKQILH